ncbi:MAG: flagellar hook-basal body complex protein [Terracidiphilus sp.]
MPSFYIPLSGLNADSTALNTIANNLSNMNTTGFKEQTTNFSDLFYQQVGANGSGDEIQQGTGVEVASNSTDFTGGSVTATGVSTNAAIDGSGFFVLDNNGSQLYTRNGDFQTSASGTLESSGGQAVMGYGAKNGVINPNGGLIDLSIPTGQVMNPSATTTMSMTTNLDSQDAVGSSTTASDQTKVYDSLGNSYEATVTYTKTGTNTWTYNITVPDALSAAPATAAAATTLPAILSTPTTAPLILAAAGTGPVVVAAPLVSPLTSSSTASVPAGSTIYSYNFGTNGTVDSTTGITIGGTALVIPGAGESVATLMGQINGLTAAQPGVSAGVNGAGNVLTITVPTLTAITGTGVVADVATSALNYQFNTGGTVDPSTTMTITGQTTTGATVTITPPAIAAGESLISYAAALNTALGPTGANIVNAKVTANAATGQLSIVGANVSTAGAVSQTLSATTTNYDFGSSATVDPALTNFKITGQTATGATATITAPTITAGETVANYAAALTAALGPAGANLVGVTVQSAGGQLTITGANISTTGSMSQDLQATTVSYNFGSSNGTLATVNPATNLTITGLTPNGSTATTVAPTVTPGESLATYVTALTTALTNAGISGVTASSNAAGKFSIVGANITTDGSVVQDPVASLNASGPLTFSSSGQLVSPATNLSGISFSGLSDGAATLNMNWSLFGANNTANISQTASADSTSATSQNGYAPGTSNGFTIGSDGTIATTYSNGQTQNVGQIALATVNNQQGLVDVGSTDYQTTSASGNAALGVAGTGGLGTIQGSSLEASNVNISAEFSDLIVAQRAFEANSKAVTTFDTITQETINMIH